MGDAINNEPEFLWQTLLILRALLRRNDNPSVRLAGDRLYLADEELRRPADVLSERELKDRIRELARRAGLPDVSVGSLAEIWRTELTERALSRSELLERGELAILKRNPHETDLVRRWRDELLARMVNQLADLNAVERFDAAASAEERERRLELGPLIEDWPRRILEDDYWKYAEAPLPEMKPLALDDVWVDLFLSDPLEATEEREVAAYQDWRDERQRWRTEPAAFVLERVYGATALVGPPGCGKTTLLKWFARQLIARPQGRFLLPLYVPLRKYARARYGAGARASLSLLEFALRQCGITQPAQLALWMPTISYLTGADRANVLLMLDGWDEVPAEHREPLLAEIDDLAHAFAIIITSRPSGFPRLLPVSHIYEIASLSPDNSERLIRRWFDAAGAPDQAEEALHHLDAHPDLRRLARNPFLLSLLCGICRHAERSTMSAAISRTALYRQAIQLIVAHHNRHFPRPITAIEERKMERLALWLQADAPDAPRYVFDRADVQQCLDEMATLETVRSSRLLSQLHLDRESFYFLHTTFQEYLAARGLLGEPPETAELRLRERAYDLGWQEILCFAAGESADAKSKQRLRRILWQQLSALARQPDRFGLVFVRLAQFVGEAGAGAGGRQLLGVDVRDELWRAIERGVEVNTFVDAFAELDPDDLLRRIEARLGGNPDERIRARLLRAMGRFRSPETARALVGKVLRGDDNTAAIAAYASHRVLDAESFQVLRAAVTNGQLSEQQRIRALRTLGNARDSLIVPSLAELARQPLGALSIEAIKALGRIGDATASAALVELLSETGDVARQEFIITALGQARDPVARDRLIEEITYRWSDDPLLPAALEALIEKPFYHGVETVAGLLRRERPEVRAAAAQALADSARTTYGHELARVAQEDGVKAVRLAALQSLVKQGGPQEVLKLARLADDEAVDVEERAEALASALQICARLTPDSLTLRLLSRSTLDALRTPSGLLAMSAAMHAHVLGDQIAERLLEVCRDEQASDSVREEACRSLARQLGQMKMPRNGDHTLREQAADILLELVRREPATVADEEEPNLDPRQRLAQAAAAALTEINAERLLGEPGTTCANALAAFAVRTGCLVFPDRIINASGQTIASLSQPSLLPEQSSNTETDSADQASREALRRVRRWSRIAADDAQQVIQAAGTEHEVLLGPELYVQRDIEQEIYARLEKSERGGQPVNILVTGEAGHGKTSLLWRLHQTLGEAGKWEPWFIKSTLLALAPRAGEAGGLHLDDLLAAARLARIEGRRPLVLLDTVDALLHGEEAERERVVEALLTLSEEGCGLIAACRPQEAMLLGPLRRGSLRLDEYKGRELTEAIDKHVAHFYAYADLRTREEHRAHINSVVARGLPLREVCVNPLTLRMLFVLYAPDPVPAEVNVFDLYDKFWRDRVVTDRRAGSPLPQPNAANLEKAASLVALVMLAEGQPELPAQQVRDGVVRCGGNAAEVAQLVSRGVLHGQDGATLHFFHQTFFEHSAARAILDHFGENGLSLLQRRLADRPHDMFLSPVYEQALLLAETSPAVVRRRADDLLGGLFRAGSAIERSSAAYIYAHRKNVPPTVARQFQELLKTADTALVRRFLTVAPNLPIQRWEDLFHELDLIWERGKWEERAHTLDLLERLAVRDDRRVLGYLTRHEVFDYILKLPFHFQGATRLLRIYAALAVRQPARSWELVSRFYGFGIQEQSQDLQISAINALAEYAALYGPENIARRFEEMARNTAGTPPRFNEVFPQAIGRLWTIEWRARNVPVETVIEAVNDPQADEVQTRARLYGLAGLVVDSDNVADAAQLFESFRREADVHRQWLWARMCLPGLLGAEVEDDDLLPAVRHARREIIAIFRDRIRQAKSAAEALPDAQRIFLMAREAVEKANFSPARLAALLDFAEAEAPGGWLDRGLFAELLPDACVGGHGGAAEAMRLLANAPEQFPEAPVVPIALRLSMLAAEHREAVWQFLALTARVGSAEGAAAMVRTLELLQPPAAEIIDNLKASLNAFRQMLITSRSVPTQRTGFALWWHLVRLGVCDPPSLDEIRRQLEQKSDVTTRAELVNLLAQAAVKNRLAAQEVAALLLPLAALKDQKLGKAALTALVNLIIELPVEAPEFILKALDVALAAPTDSGRPTLFGRVIEFLSARNVALATEILKRILRAPAIAELGKQAQKDIANRLRSPARQLVRVMTQRQRNQMLALTPAIAPLLQRVIVEAVCHEAFLPSIVALDQLLASEGLADHTVELIRRQKYARERSAGGETWLELYDLVRQGVDSHSVANLKIGLEHPAVNDDFEGDHLSDKELTFIHLSDIHFHPDEHGGFIGVDDDIRHQLINDVESWCHGRESITAILVTGDIAYSGSAKQYVTAERWLKEICQRAGCDPKNVWMVPGNHDVNRQIADRSKSLQDCHRNLRQINPDVNPGAIDDHLKGYLTDEDFKNTFLKPLNDYISFASKYGCQIGAEKVYWEKDVQLNDGSTLRLRGMTTALISDKYDDNKNNKLVLGRHQAVCRDEKGVVYMTLAHHPPAWLLDEDEVDDYLKARASIHLFGHKHRQRVEKAERYIRLSAGATNPEENQLNWKPCYNFISITVLKEKAERKMRVRVYTRIWDEQHKVFLPQSQPDGQQFVEWVKRLDSWEPPAPTPVIDASEQINSDWLALLRRIAEGERFLRPVNESEDELKSFASQANGLLELRRLGYLDFSDRAVVKESQTGHSYVTIVGPCRITYQGEQLTKVIGKSDHGQTQTTAVAKPRLGIVIALGEEFAELFREIEGSFISDRDPDTGRNYYFFERASSATGKTYRNVATFVGGMGPTQAALVSQAMMIRYAPQTMVMLGIAGGIDGDVCIGDIIIPTVVDAYLENSKAEKSASGAGFDFILGSKPFRPSTGWIRLVEHLPFAHKAIFDLWQEECADDWLALIPDATTREELLSKACVREKAGLVTGHLASGPTVGATEKFSEWLKTHRDRKYLGLEMEAAGLMAAANEYLHAKDTLVVRAVSDFGDERKKEMEQKSKGVLRRYAVRNAIRLLWLLVEANDTINQRQK